MADLRERLQSGLADRYRLERELGRGGMATVYLAHDLKHDRKVALKVLHPELAATLGPERFQREIRTTARLQHPHILPVLDSGESAGQLWYTMPYVEGESLRDRLRRECQLPLDDALQITREVADALGYAHGQGIVHRDIKPENILLSRGHALVADFGIARGLQMAGADQLTETGVAVGTPAYMSPEQTGGASSLDGRSDLYSLGCVLYEMLTGEVPYTGRTPQAVIAKRVLEPLPHVRTLRESVPEAVEQAINRALAMTPADRFATAGEFARALAQPLTAPATTNTPAAPHGGRRRRVSAGVTALAIVVLLGLGVLLAWLHTRPEAGTASPKRLAVLPFENLGDSADAYFADGVTDAVRDKLAALPGLEVIASASANQYRHTTKHAEQIGRELSARYLLVGRVRWAKAADGVSRVQVRPELIDARTGAERWGEPFEAPLTEIFQAQADIAGRVAQALGVALGAGERERLAERPTQNLAAYDAFLRGEEAGGGNTTLDPVALRRGRDYYERAVALDPNFALAWAQLSRTHSNLYFSDVSSMTPTEAGQARRAAERVLALAPKRPDGYLALGDYYIAVQSEPAQALEQYARGQRLAPKDARLLTGTAIAELTLGRADAARVHLREAELLDPRSVETARDVVVALLALRSYSEALTAADRGLALVPDNLSLIQAKATVYLAQGDLAGARGVLRAAGRQVDPTALIAYMAQRGDLYWVLDDDQQQLLLRLTPAAFADSRADWGLELAGTHALRGDTALARAYADSARVAVKAQLRGAPENAVLHAVMGVLLGYLGRRTEAIREGQRAIGLTPVSKDLGTGGYVQLQLARIYVLVGEPEPALDQLEPLLKMHWAFLSPGWLRINPTFAPLRGNPRFQRLVSQE